MWHGQEVRVPAQPQVTAAHGPVITGVTGRAIPCAHHNRWATLLPCIGVTQMEASRHRGQCCACKAWLSIQACGTEHFANPADGGLKKEDLQGLEKSSIFLFILHSPNPIAAPLFAPCSTQRLYLHEHADFEGISDVSPHTPRPHSLPCHADCIPALLALPKTSPVST